MHRLRGVFLTALGAEGTEIEAVFRAAIRIAKEQKSVSLEKRAEATYAKGNAQNQKKISLGLKITCQPAIRSVIAVRFSA